MINRRAFLVALAGLAVTRKWKPASVPDPAFNFGDPGLASYGIGNGFISPEAPMPRYVIKAASPSDMFPLGTVVPFGGRELPAGWVPCDGRRVAALGGSVPDLRGRHVPTYDDIPSNR